MTYRNDASLDPGVLLEHRHSTLLILWSNVTHRWRQFLSWQFGNFPSSCNYCWEEPLVCNQGSTVVPAIKRDTPMDAVFLMATQQFSQFLRILLGRTIGLLQIINIQLPWLNMTYRNDTSLDPGVLLEHRHSTLLILWSNVTHRWRQFLSWQFGNFPSSCNYCWEEPLVCNQGSTVVPAIKRDTPMDIVFLMATQQFSQFLRILLGRTIGLLSRIYSIPQQLVSLLNLHTRTNNTH